LNIAVVTPSRLGHDHHQGELVQQQREGAAGADADGVRAALSTARTGRVDPSGRRWASSSRPPRADGEGDVLGGDGPAVGEARSGFSSSSQVVSSTTRQVPRDGRAQHLAVVLFRQRLEDMPREGVLVIRLA